MPQAPAPHRPFFIRAINASGKALNRVVPDLPTLNNEKLIAKACKDTGLSDFGNENFREGLQQFTQALEQEAQLNTMGRMMINTEIVRYLSNKLRFEDFAKQHPDLRQQEVARPIFILGLPRTGTTILFNLLAMDPTTRAPLSWEMQDPFPPPRQKSYRSDPRIATCRKQFGILDNLEPRLKTIHEFDAQLPQECVPMYRHEFLCMEYNISYFVPGYHEWLKNQSLIPALEFHKAYLQHLQYYYKKERWILKSPAHLPSIEEILAVYPNACIIQTHRDPTKVAPSLTSLAYALQGMGSDHVDPHRVGKQQMDLWEYSLNKAMAARKKLTDKKDQFIDIQFEETIRDPFATIQRIYRHFDIPYTKEAERLMRSFLASNQEGKHGKHHYSLEMFGLDEASNRERFADYCEMFDIPTGG